jgi:hypothetical protein
VTRAASSIGVVAISAEDDAFTRPVDRWRADEVPLFGLISGDLVRDWSAVPDEQALFPYVNGALVGGPAIEAALWPFKALLWSRQTFGRSTYRDEGRTWWEWHQTTLERLRTSLTITWGEVATHNHFVLGAGHQAARERDGGRPPAAARRAEQLDGVLLAQTGLPTERWRPGR